MPLPQQKVGHVTTLSETGSCYSRLSQLPPPRLPPVTTDTARRLSGAVSPLKAAQPPPERLPGVDCRRLLWQIRQGPDRHGTSRQPRFRACAMFDVKDGPEPVKDSAGTAQERGAARGGTGKARGGPGLPACTTSGTKCTEALRV